MKPTNLIFLLGCSQAGKDTVGQQLVELYGFQRASFADAVKQEVADINKISIDILINQGPEKEAWRAEMIRYAEAKRAINPICWLEQAFKPYIENEGFKSGVNLVVTDCRRDAEIKWVLEQKEIINDINKVAKQTLKIAEKHYLNVYLIYINNPVAEQADLDMLTHQCIGYARGSYAIDITLINNGTLEELNKKTREMINILNLQYLITKNI